MKSYSVKDIIEFLNEAHSVINNNPDYTFDNVKPIDDADENSLVWVSKGNRNKIDIVLNTMARIIICDSSFVDMKDSIGLSKCLIAVNDPRLAFIRIVGNFFTKVMDWGIDKSAIIHEKATIHPRSHIGPHCYIGHSTIGKGTVIYGNCFIYDNVVVGENVVIHAGTVIGADGFGYQRNERMEFERFPHLGGVVIENNVDIGANSCIDRGTLGNTYIKEGAKIDNLVHIAHNVVVGKHAAVIAHAMVGGSTVIGDYAWIAPNASLREAISIGENATIGLGAVVTKSVPKNEIWAGNPAKIFSK